MSSSGGRGAGLGLKLLLGAGALAYGIKEATYTGKHTCVIFTPCFKFVAAWVMLWGFTEIDLKTCLETLMMNFVNNMLCTRTVLLYLLIELKMVTRQGFTTSVMLM